MEIISIVDAWLGFTKVKSNIKLNKLLSMTLFYVYGNYFFS